MIERAIESGEDLGLRLADEPAGGKARVRRGEHGQTAMAQTEPADVGEHRRIEQPRRPELPARPAPPGADQPSPAAPREQGQHQAMDDDEERERQHQHQQQVGVQRADAIERGRARHSRDQHQERRPQPDRQRHVEREAPERGVQQPGREVGGEPRAGGEATDQHHHAAATLEPGRAPRHRLVVEPPAQRRPAQDRTPQPAAGAEQQQIADEDADEARDAGRGERQPSVRDQQAGADRREVLAHQRRQREERADGEQSRTHPPRQGPPIERRSSQPHAIGGRGRARRRFAALDAIPEVGERGPDVGLAREHEEVAGVEHDQLALRGQAVMLDRRFLRHQEVLAAVDDQDRRLDRGRAMPRSGR